MAKRQRYRHTPAGVIYEPAIKSDRHFCEKPVSLMLRLLLKFQERSVADPAMGVGTTGVACIQLGRQFTGIEIHEPYFDIACRRIEEATRQGRLPLPEPVTPHKQELLIPEDER